MLVPGEITNRQGGMTEPCLMAKRVSQPKWAQIKPSASGTVQLLSEERKEAGIEPIVPVSKRAQPEVDASKAVSLEGRYKSTSCGTMFTVFIKEKTYFLRNEKKNVEYEADAQYIKRLILFKLFVKQHE